MFRAVIECARRRGNAVDQTLLAFMSDENSLRRNGGREAMLHVMKLLSEEHAGRVLAGLRRVCAPHDVTVVPNGLEPYVLRVQEQPPGILRRLMCDPSYDERSQERYDLLARTFGYPRHDMRVKPRRRLQLVADVRQADSTTRSVRLFGFAVEDTQEARETVRRIEKQTLIGAKATLEGVRASRKGRMEIADVRLFSE